MDQGLGNLNMIQKTFWSTKTETRYSASDFQGQSMKHRRTRTIRRPRRQLEAEKPPDLLASTRDVKPQNNKLKFDKTPGKGEFSSEVSTPFPVKKNQKE